MIRMRKVLENEQNIIFKIEGKHHGRSSGLLGGVCAKAGCGKE